MNEAVGWRQDNFIDYLYICYTVNRCILKKLWKNFKAAMSEDYVRHFCMLQEQQKAYAQIGTTLSAKNKKFLRFSTHGTINRKLYGGRLYNT